MARKSTSRKSKKSKKVSVDFSNVGKAFEPDSEYQVKVLECTWEEGQKAPMLSFKLCGAEEEYENSFMYYRASTSDAALWKLRPLLEAFGIEIPEGPMEIDPDDLVGRTAIATTFLDRWDGGQAVKPNDFFPDDGEDSEDRDGDDEDQDDELDLDELDEDDITALAKALKIKSRTDSARRKNLAKLDDEELAEAGLPCLTTMKTRKTRKTRTKRRKRKLPRSPRSPRRRRSRRRSLRLMKTMLLA